MKRILTVAVLLLGSLGSHQLMAQFSITGEIRPRAEYRHGFKTLASDGSDAAFFIEQRSRLYLDFKKSRMQFKLALQDVRIWGGVSQIYKDDNTLFNVYEAWGQYALSEASSIKLGRQELEYDNARILGNLDWAQQGRSHDLVKYIYQGKKGSSLHLGVAFNQEDVVSNPEPRRLFGTFYSGVNNYKTMQYAWYHKDFEKATISLLFLNNGIQDLTDSSGVNFGQTYGVYATKKLKGLSLVGEAYYQGGKDALGRDINAHMLALNATFKAGKLPITIGTDYLSGTDPGSTKNHSFTPLYGTNHKFYGFMDYFYVGNGHGNRGLVDVFLKTKFTLSKKSSLLAHLHQFSAAADVNTEGGESMSSNFGSEVDLVYVLKVSPEISFNLGYSQFFGSESLEFIKGGDKSEINNWAWMMFTFKPKLFESKNDN